ncbi:MAG: M14 family zinc carboxypeptidase, partial [Patescibacteria group bacterium]
PTIVPANIKVTVIPVLNPDGLNKTVGTPGRFTQASVPTASGATVSGRFNAHTVDLNRNFDCDWQASATWQNKAVSG